MCTPSTFSKAEGVLSRSSLPADECVAGKVLAVLGLARASELTRERYEALSRHDFEKVLAALLEELDLTIAEAKRLFCDRLKWCKRRRGWARLKRNVMARIPERYHARLKKLGPAANFALEGIQLILQVPLAYQATLFTARVFAYLAAGGLDRLCGCKKPR